MLGLSTPPPPPRPFGTAIAGFIAVAGTWSRERVKLLRAVGLHPEPAWYEHGSRFACHMMQRYGIFRLDRNGDISTPDPPLWDGALEGTSAHLLKSRLQGKTPLEKWIVPSRNVTAAITRVPANVKWVIVFAHSHGGNVAAPGIANVFFKRDRQRVIFITIDTPNRWGASMRHIYWKCSVSIAGRWVHLHSGADWGSRMRWLGARTLPWKRQEFDQAGINIAVPDDEDHSGVLGMEPDDTAVWDRVMAAAGHLAAASAAT